jgi:uncharacterized damage-inducible protein DinB
MARQAIERLEALLRRSFDRENTQSLIGNLAKVRAEDWDWVPPNGERSIRRIFEHAAIAKHIYTKFLFTSERPAWSEIAAQRPADVDGLVAWAREGHAAFMAGMSGLRDGDLATMTTKWHGARDTIAEVIAVMIQHDCYHAGEINHIRALRQRDDGTEL